MVSWFVCYVVVQEVVIVLANAEVKIALFTENNNVVCSL